MTKEQEKTVTWFQVNNIVAITVSTLMIAGTFFAMQTSVALLNQKLDFLISTQTTKDAEMNELRSDVSKNTLDIRELKTKVGIQ